ncbi:hypothetical protein Acsp01_34620 [Actinoplanes sp. NBRC 101535]|nr:hypothetical protein Acsp01_34620 [Actinoplanes sp. NBRC 101535]
MDSRQRGDRVHGHGFVAAIQQQRRDGVEYAFARAGGSAAGPGYSGDRERDLRIRRHVPNATSVAFKEGS